ncbi:dihydrodipicolinate synthase family protein [Glutamicibacter halophytocola]|uniref:Dihydrodipicolinate synthase family protein n=1 Tax=Glutamicibacter halophytocola TaxID=1933880 RepID=A0ABX5Y557_9MICC|nr:dihydrodipicolinate synthase family protein [Glutamicibacter halophytocola]MBF6671675.1 dihydrodipicolinate synthase family protein [Glutamicibacter sp. FBE19]QDY65230.1 dihydrodipicolinate synthase family protein [Glutamicibacter halophytocola]
MKTFTGLSAFPLTPLADDKVDESAFSGLVRRLSSAGVDSITALGSTGSYMYLDRAERARVAQLAVANAAGVPVVIGVGAMRTSHVVEHIDDAAAAGADGVLLAPVGYQRLGESEVLDLYRTATEHSSLPVIVYDNPGTTHFAFSNDLYARIASLPGIASIKIPGVPDHAGRAKKHVDAIRSILPEHVGIGVSGDAFGAAGLVAGCDAWYTAVGGTIPGPMLDITRAVQAGDHHEALEISRRLEPLWSLFTEFGGSLRISAAIAEHFGLAAPGCLPLPIHGLSSKQRQVLIGVLNEVGLDETAGQQFTRDNS